MQANLTSEHSQIADLQENIKFQQAETSKAKDELTSALAAMEKLKETFKKEWADWGVEKAALQKRVEDKEAALKPVAEELTGLKRQKNSMTAAVFGKYPHLKFSTHIISSVTGLLMLAMTKELVLPICALTCG